MVVRSLPKQLLVELPTIFRFLPQTRSVWPLLREPILTLLLVRPKFQEQTMQLPIRIPPLVTFVSTGRVVCVLMPALRAPWLSSIKLSPVGVQTPILSLSMLVTALSLEIPISRMPAIPKLPAPTPCHRQPETATPLTAG